MVVYTYNNVPFSRSHVRATWNELDVFSRTPSEASFIAKCTKKSFSRLRFVDHGSAHLRFTNQEMDSKITLTVARAHLNQST